jgi:hypothetical protein
VARRVLNKRRLALGAPPAALPSGSDAWIFASLAARGSTRLRDLIARADMLNRAIPTGAEIRSAIRYLHGRGLVVARGQTISLTAIGRKVYANGLGRRGGLFKVTGNMEKALRSKRFPHKAVRARSSVASPSDAAVHRAYVAYDAWFNSLKLSSRRRHT